MVGIPAPPESAELTRWLTELRRALVDCDPAPPKARGSSGDLRFNGTAFTLDLLAAEHGEGPEPGRGALAVLRLAA